MEQREKFASRLGFILISAGCAIGLGNVWRFPYITGKYGGGAFVLMYLAFLICFTLPIVAMELSVGRGSQKSYARAFEVLKSRTTAWRHMKWFSLVGNFVLMMFYTTVSGWMLSYIVKSASGTFAGLDADGVAGVFGAMLGNPFELVGWMAVVVLVGVVCTGMGLQGGVERITKVMMIALLTVLIVLAVRSLTLPGAMEGLAFYLMPDFGKLTANGLPGFLEAAYAALGQAFFTMSVGIGGLAIFGSYIDKDHALTGEALRIAGLDTFVAIVSGLVIFPACFAYGVSPDAGPGLVFNTLPVVFEAMPGGHVWGALFFVFMSFAALSTVIGVFELIMSFTMDQWGISRRRAVAVNGALLFVLSIPCALGFNVLSGVVVPGIGDIQSVEDFIVSNNLLPIGSLLVLLFCTRKGGWGWNRFIAEADAGQGVKFPQVAFWYVKYVIPVGIAFIIVMGYVPIVQKWLGMA
ncbi:sodium-dependent transporter [Eggerthellaceae bacterium zg-1084]|uniref:sodium-dependent transporter n=1 Tax=Berryella wangjianweii TaxID=2734634 RepID=UPI001557EE96|nr:sodium-dependent transporter [Berryella wangjianweii]NPD30856.1 sodium-dependent transporter [Berryella wangjianweii]NPD31723.1 sodium-dependent transporter [Eggerthellaceae bacterium zg-997]